MITRLDQLEMAVNAWKGCGYESNFPDEILTAISLVRWLMPHHAETLEEATLHADEDSCDVCDDLKLLLAPAQPNADSVAVSLPRERYQLIVCLAEMKRERDKANDLLLKIYSELWPGDHKSLIAQHFGLEASDGAATGTGGSR